MIIPVNINIANVAKKMCIYEGAFYIIPVFADFDVEMILGDDITYYVTDEENYPQYKKGA